jgi:hypothetical protein
MDIREKEDELALSDIQDYVKRHHPWLYLDGQDSNAKNITMDQLKNAQLIVLTHSILGG